MSFDFSAGRCLESSFRSIMVFTFLAACYDLIIAGNAAEMNCKKMDIHRYKKTD